MAIKGKAFFHQRLIAFIIDVVFITVIASLISTPFIDSKKIDGYTKESKAIVEKYTKGKINEEEYFISYTDVYYKLNRDSGVLSLITIIIEILYFVVYQLYREGQTIGKRIMKIRVVSEDGNLFMNQMIYRSLLANLILVNIITFSLLVFSSKSVYVLLSFVIQSIQYLLMFASFIMIVNDKKGRAIHDRLAHTKVVKVN